jgi:hypothetical protein
MLHQILLGRMRWREYVVYMHEMKNAYKILVRKCGGKTPLRGPWHRCEDNIRMNFREIGCEDVD